MSLAITSFGVPAGASSPAHEVTEKPLRPDSCIVGRPGAAPERLSEVTPMPRSLPLRAGPIAHGMVSKPNCTSLAISASIAGPPPAPATLAMRRLIPQLPSFRASHPQVEVRISTAFSNDPVLRGSFDVGIRRSADDRAQFEVLPLLAEQTTVIASPAYLKQRKVRRLADLAQAVWLSTESRPGDWENWLASAGCAELRPAQMLRFDHFFVTLQAVVDGMGLGIGPFPTLDSDLERGRITTRFPKLISRGSEYFALVPRDSDNPKFLRDFLEWSTQLRHSREGGNPGLPVRR